jgi:hypothetical protein
MKAISRWVTGLAGLVFIAPSLQADALGLAMIAPIVIAQLAARRRVDAVAGQ